MNNLFSYLDIDEEDTSTNNLRRKLEKKIRQQKKNPTHERAIAIDKLNLIINPTINKKKKVNNMDSISEDDILDREYKQNKDYWFKERERIEKEKIEQELKKKKEKEEKIAREKQEKQRKKDEEKQRKREKKEKEKQEKNEIIKKLMELPDDIRNFISLPPDKKIYNKLALKYHPDKGGNIEYFKIINNYMNE